MIAEHPDDEQTEMFRTFTFAVTLHYTVKSLFQTCSLILKCSATFPARGHEWIGAGIDIQGGLFHQYPTSSHLITFQGKRRRKTLGLTNHETPLMGYLNLRLPNFLMFLLVCQMRLFDSWSSQNNITCLTKLLNIKCTCMRPCPTFFFCWVL